MLSTLGYCSCHCTVSRVVSCVPFQRFPNLIPERACFSLPSAATWPVSGFHRPGARRVFGPTCPEAVSKGGPPFALRLWWTSPRMRSTPTWLSARTLGKRKRGDGLGANPTGSHRFGSEPGFSPRFRSVNRSEHKTLAGCCPHNQSDGLAAKPGGAMWACGAAEHIWPLLTDSLCVCLSVTSICACVLYVVGIVLMSAPMTAIATTRGQHFSPSKAALQIVASSSSQMLPQAHLKVRLETPPTAASGSSRGAVHGKAFGSATLLAVPRLCLLDAWSMDPGSSGAVRDSGAGSPRSWHATWATGAQFLPRALASPGV